jgi:Fe2+ transport system protein B
MGYNIFVFKVIFARKIFIFFCLGCFFHFQTKGQNEQLNILLTERGELYKNYTEALDQKSGFFGGRSKADLEGINEVLKEIIKKDNAVLEALDNSKSKDYETLQIKYNDLIAENDKIKQKNKALENLIRQEKKYQKINVSQFEKAQGNNILLILVGLIMSAIFGWIYFKLKSKNKKLVEALNKKIDQKLI